MNGRYFVRDATGTEVFDGGQNYVAALVYAERHVGHLCSSQKGVREERHSIRYNARETEDGRWLLVNLPGGERRVEARRLGGHDLPVVAVDARVTRINDLDEVDVSTVIYRRQDCTEYSEFARCIVMPSFAGDDKGGDEIASIHNPIVMYAAK
jgi:hypothetical protein